MHIWITICGHWAGDGSIVQIDWACFFQGVLACVLQHLGLSLMRVEDLQLRRLQEEEQNARQRYFVMHANILDAEIRRHAKEIWLEAQAAIAAYTASRQLD